jgi:hypothetical protein
MISCLAQLASAYDHSLTPEGIEVYTTALDDLSPNELQHGFRRAVRELKWWPKPSELREMCTGRKADMTDSLRVDRAWNWTHWYIDMFGVPAFGHPSKDRWKIQGGDYNGRSPEVALRGAKTTFALATSAPFYSITVVEVPDLPHLVVQTLIAMGGTVEAGLARLKDAIAFKDAATASKDAKFARKDWDEHCARAIAATRIPGPSAINPALQLEGAVADEFPMPLPRAIAVRIAKDSNGYTIRRLTWEEATTFNDAGSLTPPLYEDALRHHLADEAKEELRGTPQEFNAVYEEMFIPWQIRDGSEPCRMGSFKIESADGSYIVREALPMSVGDMQLERGQVVRLTAKPKDLRYEDGRFHFDLATMTAQETLWRPSISTQL